MVGLDRNIVRQVDWQGAVDNIIVDTRSDFILAPHFDLIYRQKSAELVDQTVTKLRAGNYNPQLPITISVPKAGHTTRPGSILYPADRLVYQGLVESILPQIEQEFDRRRAFSHVPSAEEGELFVSSHETWENFQAAVSAICRRYDPCPRRRATIP
jgi:hypothetical protein